MPQIRERPGGRPIYQAKRVDKNQPAIVAAFRSLGCAVTSLHMVGSGFPDIIVGIHGLNILVEIKNGENPPSKRKLTPDEQRWHMIWPGQVCIVKSSEEVEALVKTLRAYAQNLHKLGIPSLPQGEISAT